MNFFKLYIGDYQRDTGTLSLAEHGAYLLMLQHFYATEQPLPEGRALHRLLRCETKVEREAADFVASQFWQKTDAGLVNDRAMQEFGRAAEISETNRAIALKREEKKRERREHEQSTKRAQSVPKTCHEQSTNQTPDTRHQTKTKTGVTDAVQDSTTVGAGEIACGAAPGPSTSAGDACKAMIRAGVSPGQVNPGHATLLALIDAGATTEEFGTTAAECVGKGKPSFAYVLGTVKRRREEAAKLVLHKGRMLNKQEALEAGNRAVGEEWERKMREKMGAGNAG